MVQHTKIPDSRTVGDTNYSKHKLFRIQIIQNTNLSRPGLSASITSCGVSGYMSNGNSMPISSYFVLHSFLNGRSSAKVTFSCLFAISLSSLIFVSLPFRCIMWRETRFSFTPVLMKKQVICGNGKHRKMYSPQNIPLKPAKSRGLI